MLLGNRFKDLRLELGLSQSKLAKKIGVSTSMITLYENNERKPSYDVMIQMSRCFGVTVDYLLGISDKRDYMLDATGLTNEQIKAVLNVIELYRNANGR